MTGLALFNLFILVFMVVAAVISLRVKDLLTASVVFGIYSFLMCLLWAEMGAVDVAFTEAAVGAGVSAVFLVATVFNVKTVTDTHLSLPSTSSVVTSAGGG